MTDFLFPDVGEGIHEGKLVSWKIKQGDTVKADQVLCEVETDKAIVEIPSPQAGKIAATHGNEGDTITVGDVLVTFDGGTPSNAPEHKSTTPSEPVTDGGRPQEQGTKKVESTLVPAPPQPHEHHPPIAANADVQNQQGPAVPAGPSNPHPGHVLATPSTRKLAREKGIDISTIKGSGPHGRVIPSDLTGGSASPQPTPAAAQSQAAAPTAPSTTASAPAAAPIAGTTVAYDGRRKAIGEHMVRAQQVPAVTLFARADASAVVALRERYKPTAEKRGIKLTYLALFARALVGALRVHPGMNARFTDKGIEVASSVHLGIAVDAPKGLVVPVVRDAHAQSALSIAADIQRLADLARTDKLSIQDMSGSTFSISSIGPLRVEGFTPMINTPETAILGIGAILDEPWVVDGAVSARKVVTLSLTFDHRVVDGAAAARFLTDVVRFIEDPDLLLVEGQ